MVKIVYTYQGYNVLIDCETPQEAWESLQMICDGILSIRNVEKQHGYVPDEPVAKQHPLTPEENHPGYALTDE